MTNYLIPLFTLFYTSCISLWFKTTDNSYPPLPGMVDSHPSCRWCILHVNFTAECSDRWHHVSMESYAHRLYPQIENMVFINYLHWNTQPYWEDELQLHVFVQDSNSWWVRVLYFHLTRIPNALTKTEFPNPD